MAEMFNTYAWERNSETGFKPFMYNFPLYRSDVMQSAPQSVWDHLEWLCGLRERPDYHPEPSTFHHVAEVCRRLDRYVSHHDHRDQTLIFVGVLHDIKKLETAKIDPKTGWVTSPMHGQAAADWIESDEELQAWITRFGASWKEVADCCRYHMRAKRVSEKSEQKQGEFWDSMHEMGIDQYLRVFARADDMLTTFNPLLP